MKKKGLIISTVVMVVVLIASLTTATYAWFSSTAAARISELNVQTVASSGLTIAAMGATDATSGTMTLGKDDKVWSGANASFGDTLEFTTPFGDDSVYGCSGDGSYLVTAANDAGERNGDGAIASGKPKNVINAEKNVQYFEIDIAVQTTENRTNDTDLVLTNFKVTADGAMAAASRIAFYTSKAVGTEGQDGYKAKGKTSTFGLAADQLANVLMAEPFAPSKYFNNTWNSTGTTPSVYNNAETALKAYDTANVTKDITAAPYVYVKGTATFNNTNQDNIETFDVTNKALGTFAANTPNDTVYLRLVIWFEGEDAECISAWAGTGITVNMEFGYKA